MRGDDLRLAQQIIAEGQLPQRKYSKEEDERWQIFLGLFKRWCNLNGYHPGELQRDEMEGLSPQSWYWIRQTAHNMQTQDIRWQEFQELFARLCSEWGYKVPELARKDMETSHEDRTKIVTGALKKRSSITLAQLIGSYIPVDEGEAQCPFCDDGTITINGDRWQCDACGPDKCDHCHCGGDILDFISRYEHCTREEAAQMLKR